MNIAAGKTAIANIILPPAAFEFYDDRYGKMAVMPGEYEVLYGNSSADKDCKVMKITIKYLK